MMQSLIDYINDEWSRDWVKHAKRVYGYARKNSPSRLFVSDFWSHIGSCSSITWNYIHTHRYRSWDFPTVSCNPNITWEIVQANKYEDWDYTSLTDMPYQVVYDLTNNDVEVDFIGVSSHSRVTLEMIRANPNKWDGHGLSSNPNVTREFFDSHPGLEWDFKTISTNPNLTSWDDVCAWDSMDYCDRHPGYAIAYNPNVTFELVLNDIEENGTDWGLSSLSSNPSTTPEIIEAHPEVNWNYMDLSKNPSMSWKFVFKHVNKGWWWNDVLRNPMNGGKQKFVGNMLIKKGIDKDLCKDILSLVT